MKNGIRVVICVMLVVAVLAMSLSVFATDPEPTPTPELDEGLGAVTDEMLSRYIWMCLRAWGINIAYQDMDVFYDEVEDQIIDWVVQYLAGLPSAYSINQWIAPWQGGFDYWGNLRLNSSALEDIQDFTNWLIQLLGLENNSTEVVNPVYTIGGYNLYKVNQWYVSEWRLNSPSNSDYVVWQISVSDYTGDLYFMPTQYSDGWGYILMTDNGSIAYGANVSIRYSSNMADSTLFEGSGMGNPLTTNVYGLKYWVINFVRNGNGVRPDGGTYFVSTHSMVGQYSDPNSDIRQFMDVAKIHQEGDLAVVTGTIMPPAIDPAYTEGDSITIIDGEPEYSLVEWQSVTVENLPAVVSTQKVSDPHLDTFWGFIPVLAEQTKDAIVLARGLIYELPEEIVVPFYSVMGGIILFGIIKLMREH